MTRVRLRSRRDPAVWGPVLVLILVLAAIAVWGQVWMSTWLEAIEGKAASDPEQAAAEAIRIIRLCEVALFVTSAAFGAFLYRFFQLGLRESRIPPSGWWSLGAWQAVVGPSARRMSRIGLVVSLLLPASAIAIVLVVEVLLRTLAEGRLAT